MLFKLKNIAIEHSNIDNAVIGITYICLTFNTAMLKKWDFLIKIRFALVIENRSLYQISLPLCNEIYVSVYKGPQNSPLQHSDSLEEALTGINCYIKFLYILLISALI
jgi:hypothetical protein